MAPPVSAQPVVAGGAGGEPGREQARRVALVGRRWRPRAAARRRPGRRPAAVSAPVGQVGPFGAAGAWRRRRAAPTTSARASSAAGGVAAAVSPARGPRSRRAPGSSPCPGRRRSSPGALASTSTRWRRPSSCADGELGQVGEPLDRRQAGAPLEAGRERLGQHRRAPVALATRLAATSASARSAAPPRSRPHGSPERRALATASTTSASTGRGGPAGDGLADDAAGGPAHVGRQDQRGHLPGRPGRRRHGLGRVPADVGRLLRPAAPTATRCGPPSRCRTRAGRRTACGRWRGRRRC